MSPALAGGFLTIAPPGKSWNWGFLFFFFLRNAFICFIIYLFIYLFLAVLGLHFCARAFSSCGERGLLFIAVRRLLIAVASLVAEHGL